MEPSEEDQRANRNVKTKPVSETLAVEDSMLRRMGWVLVANQAHHIISTVVVITQYRARQLCI
jgi:hypothetical protein